MKMRVLILAAGKGSRMGASVPKPLVELGGVPILKRILEAVKMSGVDLCPAILIGYEGAQIRQALAQENVQWIVQEEQKGTGHAVRVALPYVDSQEADHILVTYGDHGLYTAATYQSIAEQQQQTGATITMLTTCIPNFEGWRKVYTGYGRILRNTGSCEVSIREAKLCSPEELAVREVNNGMYMFRADWLRRRIQDLSDANTKGEFLLTDLIQFACHDKEMVTTVSCEDWEGIGVNTPEELALAEQVLKQKHSN